MPDFAFRISVPWTECSHIVIPYLKDICSTLVIYEHEADEDVMRTHIHGLIMGCQRSDDTLRNMLFKKEFTKNYELKSTFKTRDKGTQPVGLKFITYMSKGKLEPQYFHGITKEAIDEYKAAWVDYGLGNPAAKEKKEKDPTKAITRYEFIKECYEQYNKDFLHTRFTGKDPFSPPGNKVYPEIFDQAKACEIVIAKAIEHKQSMGFYKLVDVVDNVHMLRSPVSFHKKLHGYFVKRDEKLSSE